MSEGYGESLFLPAGKFIRNVNGSQDDPKPCGCGSWLGLWSDKTSSAVGNCCVCNHQRAVYGGHVILGRSGDTGMLQSETVVWGSDRVFLAPLCSTCNCINGPMQINNGTDILQLCGYHFEDAIEYVHDPIYYSNRVDSNDQSYVTNGSISAPSPVAVPSAASVPGGSGWIGGGNGSGWQGQNQNQGYENTYNADSDFSEDPDDGDYFIPSWGR